MDPAVVLVHMDSAVVLDHSWVVARAVPMDLVVADHHNLLVVAGIPHLVVRCNPVAVVGSPGMDSPWVVDSLLEELGCIDAQLDCIGLPEDHNLAEESLRVC